MDRAVWWAAVQGVTRDHMDMTEHSTVNIQ